LRPRQHLPLQPQGCRWLSPRVSGDGAFRLPLHLHRVRGVGRTWRLGQQGCS
jgi:hypothetical protein